MEILRSLAGSDRLVAEVVDGLDVVCRLLANISATPGEPKYWCVKRSNPRIAVFLGKEEEGVLREAGFQEDDSGENLQVTDLVNLGKDSSTDASTSEGTSRKEVALQTLREVLASCQVASNALRQHVVDARSSSSDASCPTAEKLGGFVCRDPDVARSLDCALLDYVAQQSVELAATEKRRRRDTQYEAVRSEGDWKRALHEAGGDFLLSADGPLAAWLMAKPDHRSLAHDLLILQERAVKWYGCGAQRHCDAWRAQLLSTHLDSAVTLQLGVYATVFETELARLREVIFDFPERPGAPPALFRLPGDVAADADARECEVVADEATLACIAAIRQADEGGVLVLET